MYNFLQKMLISGSLSALRAHLLLWPVFIAGFTADRLTKIWTLDRLGLPGSGQEVVVIENYLRFSTVFNPGAVWGAFASQTAFLLAVSFVAVCFVMAIFASSPRKAWHCHLACGMILAGAMGNIYDRLFNNGFVIDFIEVNLHFWPADPWPTFNVADSLLCVGVPLLVIPMLLADIKAGIATKNDTKDKS